MNRKNGTALKIVSFSGIDGAGKTTQIEALTEWLRQSGLRVTRLPFWDNVVAFSRFREQVSHKAFKGDQGIGSPEKPLQRRDKNVTAWPVTTMRFFLYIADAMSLWREVRRVKKSDTDVVIFDRYIYDELANLPLNRWLTRLFIRVLVRLIPSPDVAYVIDADPVAALARKPEYPLDFLRSNREAYLTVSHLTGHLTVIEPLPVEAAQTKIREAFSRKLAGNEEEFSGLPALQ